MSAPEKAQTQIARFDEQLAELEKLVEAMETGELNLEQSMQNFERGMKLSKRLEKTLAEAELKIEGLMDDEASDGSDAG